jgi:AcrR family transcriptional regulator
MPAVTKRKRTRAEKADENRKALIRAAAYVVGKKGYANASIGRITERAGLAQGTFYLYFSSQQELFDQLLPTIGEEMLEYVGKAIHGCKDFFEVEERGIRAFFGFMTKNRYFFRILYETDAVSPTASEKHYALIARKYTAVLQRALADNQIRQLTPIERDVLTYLMMGARDYLYRHLIHDRSSSKVEEVVAAYMSILRNGVGPREKRAKAPRRAALPAERQAGAS